jgi:hypothetical protein
VNDAFYTNKGSGTFIAGEEIPSTVSGHEITIKEYGMWSVTATNGECTTTQDVLVDAAVEYEIEMDYKLWLYREGDECEDVTGGWTSSGYSRSNYSIISGKKEADCLNVQRDSGVSEVNTSALLGTNAPVDLASFSTLYLDYKIDTCNDYNPKLAVLTQKSYSYNASTEISRVAGKALAVGTRSVVSLDIKNISGLRYVCWMSDGFYVPLRAYNIWLE